MSERARDATSALSTPHTALHTHQFRLTHTLFPSTAAEPLAKVPRMSLQLKVKLYAAPLLKPGFRTPSRACIPFLTTTNFIRTRRLSEFATLPVRGSALAAGYDLSASADCVVPGRGKALVGTGLSMAIPPTCYGRIAPRSGLAWKNFIDTGAGVIDADYRGEVKVLLFNHNEEDFNVNDPFFQRVRRVRVDLCVCVCV